MANLAPLAIFFILSLILQRISSFEVDDSWLGEMAVGEQRTRPEGGGTSIFKCLYYSVYEMDYCILRLPSGAEYNSLDGSRFTDSEIGNIFLYMDGSGREKECFFRLENVQRPHLGRYTCIMGSNSPRLQLNVNVSLFKQFKEEDEIPPGKVVVYNKKSTVIEGDEIKFKCSYTSFRPGYRKIEMCRIELPSGAGMILRPKIHHEDTNTSYYGEGFEVGDCGIQIRDAQFKHNGRYKCSIALPEVAEEVVAFTDVTVARSPKVPELMIIRDGGAEHNRTSNDTRKEEQKISDLESNSSSGNGDGEQSSGNGGGEQRSGNGGGEQSSSNSNVDLINGNVEHSNDVRREDRSSGNVAQFYDNGGSGNISSIPDGEVGPDVEALDEKASDSRSEEVPWSQQFDEGDEMRSVCVVREGRPAAEIAWYIGDEVINEGVSELVVDEERQVFTVTQEMRHTLRWKDHGKNLSCVAHHVSRISQTSLILHVTFRPRLLSTSFAVHRQIHVEVRANPGPNFQWTVDGKRAPTYQEMSAKGDFKSSDVHSTIAKDVGKGLGYWTGTLHLNEGNYEHKLIKLNVSNQKGNLPLVIYESVMQKQNEDLTSTYYSDPSAWMIFVSGVSLLFGAAVVTFCIYRLCRYIKHRKSTEQDGDSDETTAAVRKFCKIVDPRKIDDGDFDKMPPANMLRRPRASLPVTHDDLKKSCQSLGENMYEEVEDRYVKLKTSSAEKGEGEVEPEDYEVMTGKKRLSIALYVNASSKSTADLQFV